MKHPNWIAALESLADAYAPKTIDNRRKDYTRIAAWCLAHGHGVWPISAETMAAYVSAEMPRCAIRTIQSRLAVVRWLHRYSDLPDPTDDDEVRLAFRRGVRAGARKSRSALGLSAHIRDRLIAACPPTLLGLRDRALIAVGYDTLCRRSELVRLQIEDVTFHADGRARILVRKTKTDQIGKGGFAYLSPTGVEHLQAWLGAAGLTHGPMFRAVLGRRVGSEVLEPRIVNRTLRIAGELAKLEPELIKRLTAHSLRVGPAQDLAAAGRSTIEIMRAGRWYSVSGMMSYVREADVNVWRA